MTVIDPKNPGHDIPATDDPFTLFQSWLTEAEAKEPNDPNAMALATVDASGMPNVRMVLLKGHGPDGFVFFTNFQSAKGEEILNTGMAALCFHWKSLRRQVRVRGRAVAVTEGEADAYFESRPKDSQIGAWASQQSRPLEGRFALEAAVARFATRYALSRVPRPPHWSGFRIRPIEIEFWRDRPFRLHERLVYRRGDIAGPWRIEKLYP
jgi:pyridoxamine 5'-phosphate oxidase